VTARAVDVAAAMVDLFLPGPSRSGVFVDFDGTLAEIVDNPARARPVEGVVESLGQLARHVGVVAVISGRPGGFLIDRLGRASLQAGVRAYGQYGQEEVLPDGSIRPFSTPEHLRPALDATVALARLAAPHARIENKGVSVVFHYRETPEDERALSEVAAHAAEALGLEVRVGRMVFEIMAPSAPDKGSVANRLIPLLDYAVGFGDDLGDLPVFAALDQGCVRPEFRALKIAVGGVGTPDEVSERSDFVLGSPTDAAQVLATVAAALEGPPRERP
jgi:trehalose 6-phosphate phosphatase